MKKIRIEKQIKCSADSLWELFADVTRSDWVPFANEIVLENDVRTFKMDGVGEIKEKIIEKDQANKSLTYSVIKSPAPLNHHLAKVTVLEDNNFSNTIHFESPYVVFKNNFVCKRHPIRPRNV